MLSKLASVISTGVLGLGVVAAVTATAAGPASIRSAEVKLAATALIMGGANGGGSIGDGTMLAVLDGRYAGDTRICVQWPAEIAPIYGTTTLGESIVIGTNNLDAAIRAQAAASSAPIVAVGLSQASEVLDAEMRRLAKDPNGPSPQQVSFVVIGDSDRSLLHYFQGLPKLPILDYAVPPIPVTPYNVTVVAGEYDGFADFPDRWWNLLAVANALAGSGYFPGFGSVHYATLWTNLDNVPAKDITTTTNSAGGVTTKYLVPTGDLPLLRPLTSMGVPQKVVAALNVVLRPIVDAGYSRNDPHSVGGSAHQPMVASSAKASARPSAAATSLTKTAGTAAAKSTANRSHGNGVGKSSRRRG
jgi:hypothetical protein